MVIPAYRDVDLGLLLELLRRKQQVRPAEVYADVARHFPNLTDEDLAKTRPDGRTKVFNNMVHWARDHLRVRGLLVELPAGRWQVNELAAHAFAEDLALRGAKPSNIERFVTGRGTLPEFLGQQWAKEVGQRARVETGSKRGRRPKAARKERAATVALSADDDKETAKKALLGRLSQMEGYEFEQFIGRLLDSIGFRDTRVVGQSGDEGIDVQTYLTSPLLSVKVVVQVKRHRANVGPRDISYLRDRWAHRADKLLFITTSDFTAGAREVAAEDRQKRVDLVNGEQLVEVMVEQQLGIKAEPVLTYHLDEDYLANL